MDDETDNQFTPVTYKRSDSSMDDGKLEAVRCQVPAHLVVQIPLWTMETSSGQYEGCRQTFRFLYGRWKPNSPMRGHATFVPIPHGRWKRGMRNLKIHTGVVQISLWTMETSQGAGR